MTIHFFCTLDYNVVMAKFKTNEIGLSVLDRIVISEHLYLFCSFSARLHSVLLDVQWSYWIYQKH